MWVDERKKITWDYVNKGDFKGDFSVVGVKRGGDTVLGNVGKK